MNKFKIPGVKSKSAAGAKRKRYFYYLHSLRNTSRKLSFEISFAKKQKRDETAQMN